MRGRFAEVALPLPIAREYTYRLSPELTPAVRLGDLVLVPVGGRQLSGIVVSLLPSPPDGIQENRIRPLSQILEPEALTPELIDLCRWMADYYFAPLGSALMASIPPGLQRSSNRQVRLSATDSPGPKPAPEDIRLLDELRASGPLSVAALRRRLGSRGMEKSLRRLRQNGRIEIAPGLPKARTQTRREICFRLVDAGRALEALEAIPSRARKQIACLRHLLDGEGEASRKELVDDGFGPTVLAGLEERRLVERFEREVVRDPLAHIGPQEGDAHRPSPDQQRIIDSLCAALDRNRFHPALLQGVTGSGKTLVYIHVVARALEQGRSTIVLVPEIALAWQMVRRFKSHFGDQVAVLHSQLSEGERYDTWKRLRSGDQRLVIGPRSAILAPLPDLGLIVVDEEHDSSYKQEDLDSSQPLTYSGRDLALVRGQRLDAVVLLGSATPSLESYWNVRSGKYHLYELPHRVDDRPLARVEVVDMKREPFQKKQRAIFSHALRLKMKERLDRGEKIVLLQNRRGFAPFILCASCGEAIECRSCRVSLTYHRRASIPEMRCHYCDFSSPPPPVCPSCGGAELRFEGVGTQKVEEALLEQFSGIRVIRMDVDTTGWKGAHDELVERFRRGEADVLLGTQMVAKGLDFPEVTLVGVISADTGMHMPDFRAAERSFQLLTQVAGRSGRGQTPGEVVIQTLLPDDGVLRSAARQDFATFVEGELGERREASFPPFGRLVLLRWQGADEGEVESAARRGATELNQSLSADAVLLGPAPAPLAQLRGRYRWQALLRGDSAQRLHAIVARALPGMRAACTGSVAMTVNVDPLTMM